MSLSLGLGLGLVGPGLAYAGSAPPFTADADTYWWDFTSQSAISDTLGTDTLSLVPEALAGAISLVQPLKDFQPLDVAGGAQFNTASDRVLTISATTGLTNTKPGWYVAFVATFAAAQDSYVMEIARPSSTAASRGRIYMTSTRAITFRGNRTDGTTISTVGQSANSAVTLGTPIAVEIQWGSDAASSKMWLNGTEVTSWAVAPTGSYAAFPSGNPSQIIVGNTANGGSSLDSALKQLVFYNGIPSSGVRASISSWLQGQR